MTDATRAEMKRMLDDIVSGRYAQQWIDENKKGRPWFNARRQEEQRQPIEKVGAELRAMMPFLDPVTVTPDEQQ